MTRPAEAHLTLEVSFRAHRPWVPRRADFHRWAQAVWVHPALRGLRQPVPAVIGITVVGHAASRRLNARYRNQDRPTNVLSFAGAGAGPDGLRRLGELVICAPLMAAQARRRVNPGAGAASAARRWHWAHITVHGVLHLAGFDHERPAEARKMAALEVQILDRLGFSDPYS